MAIKETQTLMVQYCGSSLTLLPTTYLHKYDFEPQPLTKLLFSL